MASTYSTNLKIELIPTGAQSGIWGQTTNVNLGSALEQAIVGLATCPTGDFVANVATYTLADSNAPQTARAFCLNVTATLTAAGTINVPAIQKPYLVFNNSVGGFAVTVKVSGQTGVSVPNGKKAWLYNNGTDVGVAFDYAPSLTLGTALSATSGGTGLATYTAGDIVYASGTSTLAKLPIGSTGQVLRVAAGIPSWATDTTTGTVTSVSFTGGLISVATPTTTPALTVAGTSGGVPYFSSASTWATSGLLGQYGVVYGGGAGAAPVTTAAGTTGQALVAATGAAPAFGTLPVAGGGTNIITYATGDILYASGANTLSKLTIGATGTSLTVVGGLPVWAAIAGTGTVTSVDVSGGTTGLTTSGGPVTTTGTITLAGTLAITNGGTGQTTATAAFNALAPSQATNTGKYLTTDGTNSSWAPVVSGATISNDTTTATNLYPIFSTATSGTPTTVYTSDAKYLYKPSTGELQASEMVASNGLFVNATTVSANYTIAAGYNAQSVGPITVNSGISVTVTSGQRWVVM